jgi:uncharacterized protein
MENLSNEFLGTGWDFPIEFRKDTKTVAMIAGDEDIKSSLDILFKTKAGERIMHPEYGSELSYFLYMPITKSTITYMESFVRNAILFNEPRIIVNSVSIKDTTFENGRVEINIVYTVSVTNNRYNYVYPFYINEGTNLER